MTEGSVDRRVTEGPGERRVTGDADDRRVTEGPVGVGLLYSKCLSAFTTHRRGVICLGVAELKGCVQSINCLSLVRYRRTL